MVDTNGNGQVDAHEWRNFHDMFITKFTLADKDQDLLLSEKEFTESPIYILVPSRTWRS